MRSRSVGWSPDFVTDYATAYPQTRGLAPYRETEALRHFRELWAQKDPFAPDSAPQAERKSLEHERAHAAVVMVRGLFGKLMPGHFRAPLRRFRRHGWRTVVAPTETAGLIEDNAVRIQRTLDGLAESGITRIYLCAHSKGALEAMRAVPLLERARIQGLVIVQAPREPSRVLESTLCGLHRSSRSRLSGAKETMARTAMGLFRGSAGAYDLTGERLTSCVERIQVEKMPFPVVSVASWSLTPSSWADSYHRRLCEIRPGEAHDGQFFTRSMLWPHSHTILLGGVDHAQPSVGGLGFDHGRLWPALVAVAQRLGRNQL